jgi:hypothetical protein
MKQRLKDLLAEYGRIALFVYLVLFVLTLAGFYIALSAGFSVEGTAEAAGTLGAAYLATKATQLLRIGATIILTPAVAAVVHRFRPKKKSEEVVSEEENHGHP